MGTGTRVVVTGIGFFCALGNDAQTVVGRLTQASGGIRPVSRFAAEAFSNPLAAELDWSRVRAECSAEEYAQLDPAALLALAAARRALNDAGLTPDQWAPAGLMLGTCNGGIYSLASQNRVASLDPVKTHRYPFYQQGDDVAAALGLNGPVATVTTACIASANAMGMAMDLLSDDVPMMLAGGTDPLERVVFAGFNALRALSDGACQPFGERLGLTLGEGSAIFVLETLPRAVQRGARIYAELLGYGLSNDGYHLTAADPQGDGVRRAVVQALARARIDAGALDYVNAHGTGTQANDQAELNGLKQALGQNRFSAIAISSSKGHVGHTLGAAAALELALSLLCAQQGLLAPTLTSATPRAGCEQAQIIRQRPKPHRPRYILSTNSAFGGHNAAIIARLWERQDAAERPQPGHPRAVFIVGSGLVHGQKGLAGPNWAALTEIWAGDATPFRLKEAHPALYERRMNPLTQSAIESAYLAMGDAGWDLTAATREDPVGIVYASARGSLDTTARYLESIFRKGPALASGVDFPYMVLNSTPGKMAEKLRATGFGGALSTGGSDGLAAVVWAFEALRRGYAPRLLVTACDERSPLADEIDRAQGLDQSRFVRQAASACVAMTASDGRDPTGDVALVGAGWAYGSRTSGYRTALDTCLQRSGVTPRQLAAVFLNSVGRAGETESETQWLSSQLGTLPLFELNSRWGYGESWSGLAHLMAARAYLAAARANESDAEPLYALVVSGSVNANHIAVLLRG